MTDLSQLVTCGADVRCLGALIEVNPQITFDVLMWVFGALLVVVIAVAVAACNSKGK